MWPSFMAISRTRESTCFCRGEAMILRVLHCAGYRIIASKPDETLCQINVRGAGHHRPVPGIQRQASLLIYVSSVRTIPEARTETITEPDRFAPDGSSAITEKAKATQQPLWFWARKAGLNAEYRPALGILGPGDLAWKYGRMLLAFTVAGCARRQRRLRFR